MLRKLIMLAITSGLAKKLYDKYTMKQAPFPTAKHHPKPKKGRTAKA